MERRYTVFVSSTFNDLQAERDEVIKSLMRVKHIPLGMEAFNASNSSSWDVIKKAIDISDYYIVVIGNRYGSIHKTEKISFTEMEYNYASESNVPCLVFIISDDALVRARDRDDDPETIVKLFDFKKKLADDGRNVIWWNGKGDLTTKVIASLAEEIENSPRPGWTRSPEISASVLEEMTRLSKRNSELEIEIIRLKSLHLDRPSIQIQIENLNEYGVLYFSIPSLNDIRRDAIDHQKHLVKSIMESKEWSDKFKELDEYRPLKDLSSILSGGTKVYNISYSRIESVKNFLKGLKFNVENYNWAFALYGTHRFSLNLSGGPDSQIEVVSGADFEKYKLFENLESIISEVSKRIKEQVNQIIRRNIIFKFSNSSKIAVHDLQITISFTNSSVNLNTIDKNKDKYLLDRRVLSPGETVTINDFNYIVDDTMHFNKGFYEEEILVKITGSNLADPIIFQTSVQIDVGQ